MKLIVDGNSIFCKMYFKLSNDLQNSSGVKTQGIFGFIKYINNLKKRYNVTNEDIDITFDNATSKTLRLEVAPNYKGTRDKNEDLYQQLTYLQHILNAEGMNVYTLQNLEADDICFRLALEYNSKQTSCTIVSRDKDLLLSLVIGPYVQVYIDNTQITYTQEGFKNDYGFSCVHYVDYKSLLGDTSDNIQGVKGIGEVGAKALFIELDTLNTRLEKVLEESVQQELKVSEKSKKLLHKINDNLYDFEQAKSLVTPIYKWRLPVLQTNRNQERADQIYSFLEINANRLSHP